MSGNGSNGGSARLAFLCLALFLVVWPLTMQRPGLPTTLKADEPAYYLMARSLWEDRDLRCEIKDLMRLADDFEGETANLILLTRDGWRSAHFGKPYIGSLLAAPLVSWFGPGGYFALNALMVVLAMWMGWAFLRRENPAGEALLFAVGYFLLSSSYIYVYWLQPEILNLFSISSCLFFSLHGFTGASVAASGVGRIGAALFNDRARWLWAGLAIGPAANAKPFYLLAVLPGVIAVLTARRRLGPIVLLGLATAASVGGIAAGQKALTGSWSPYFGTMRRSFNVKNPMIAPWTAAHEMAVAAAEIPAAPTADPELNRLRALTGKQGNWSWVLRLPQFRWDRLGHDLRNFFIGRHTGALVYFPFLAVGFLLFWTGGGWRDLRRWGAIVAFLGYLAFSMLWHFENFHGGAGFVGNRYLVGVYPIGLYLVARLRPRLLVPAGFLAAAVFIGQVVFAPLGVMVAEPTLQAYSRSRLFRWLPFDYQQWENIPGYRGFGLPDAWLRARRDRAVGAGEWVKVVGAGESQMYLSRRTPAPDAAFLVRNWAPGNVIDVRLGHRSQRLTFPTGPPPPGGSSALVVLEYDEPLEVYRKDRHSPTDLVWKLTVTPRHAARPIWFGESDRTLVGAQFLLLGTSDVLRRDVYGLDWLRIDVPDRIAAGGLAPICVRVRNASREPWTVGGPARVKLVARWRDADGVPVGVEGPRAELPGQVEPGDEAEVEVHALAPERPGEYRLELEPVHEFVRWFGDVDPGLRHQVPVIVGAAVADP